MSQLRHQYHRFLPWAGFIAVCLTWELTVRFSGWSTQVFPGPLQVAASFTELLFEGHLIHHCVASLFRVTAGFYLATLVGVPLGMLLGRIETCRRLLNPLLQFLRPISPLAWIPLAMLWFGIGDQPAIFLIFISSFFSMAVSTMIAVESINPVYFQVAANFNFSRTEVIKKIIIPAIIPQVVTALRMTVGIAWLVVVAAEMIAVQSGLGYLILDARNGLRMDYVMVCMIVIGLIGLIMDQLMMRLDHLETCSWAHMHK